MYNMRKIVLVFPQHDSDAPVESHTLSEGMLRIDHAEEVRGRDTQDRPARPAEDCPSSADLPLVRRYRHHALSLGELPGVLPEILQRVPVVVGDMLICASAVCMLVLKMILGLLFPDTVQHFYRHVVVRINSDSDESKAKNCRNEERKDSMGDADHDCVCRSKAIWFEGMREPSLK